MFLRQVVLRGGLPFDVRIPNAETRKAIEELENPAKRAKLEKFATTDELFADVSDDESKTANNRA